MNNEKNLGTNPKPVVVRRKLNSSLFVNLIIIIVVILAVLYALSVFTSVNVLGLNKSTGDANAWKAVFLTNSQVYFGHTVNEKSDPVVLTDIYYLQIKQPLQQVDQGQNLPNLKQPQLSLVKLGNEMHGPKDEMRINRGHVLFIEDLKEDSRVVEAINAYIAGQK